MLTLALASVKPHLNSSAELAFSMRDLSLVWPQFVHVADDHHGHPLSAVYNIYK